LRLNQSIEIRLLGHGYGDGRGGRKNKFGHYVCRDQIGRVSLQLISQGAIQGLRQEHLS
jgi:hypothetical protein